jgi:hypothetical protein
MAITVLETVAKLRETATHCRVLVRGAIPIHVAQELENLAADIDAEAARLEQRLRKASRATRTPQAAADRVFPELPRLVHVKRFGAPPR